MRGKAEGVRAVRQKESRAKRKELMAQRYKRDKP